MPNSLTNKAVNKLEDIFKNNTPKPQGELVTTNGFKFKVNTKEVPDNVQLSKAKKTTSGVVPEDHVVNALKNDFKPMDYRFGSNTIKLSRTGMKHILQRHHPEFWDGSIKKTQSYFDAKVKISELQNVITNVLKQNRKVLANRGTNERYQIIGEVDGVKYKLGIRDGQVKQLYIPKK